MTPFSSVKLPELQTEGAFRPIILPTQFLHSTCVSRKVGNTSPKKHIDHVTVTSPRSDGAPFRRNLNRCRFSADSYIYTIFSLNARLRKESATNCAKKHIDHMTITALRYSALLPNFIRMMLDFQTATALQPIPISNPVLLRIRASEKSRQHLFRGNTLIISQLTFAAPLSDNAPFFRWKNAVISNRCRI
jgi:hypothetical protein